MADFLTDGKKIVIAQQILSWHEQCKSSINILVQYRTQLISQINNMKSNQDYTIDDINAAILLQNDIDNTIKNIIDTI